MTQPIVMGEAIRIRHYSWNPTSVQLGVNTLFYRVTALSGTPTDTDVATSAGNAFGPFYAALQSPATQYYGAGAAVMVADSPLQLYSEVGVVNIQPGIVGTNTVPNQASYVIALLTGLASRQARGRIYPPFPSATFANHDGTITTAGQVALQLLAAALQPPWSVAGTGWSFTLTLAVRHIAKHVPPVPDLATYNNVGSTIGRARFGTQRRRGQYGRLNSVPF